MHRLMILTTAALSLAACGKKNSGTEAAADAPAASGGEAAMTAEMPDTDDARTFAGKLVDTTVTDWAPVSSGGGARFEYTSLTFLPTGRWAAEAFFEADFEKMECKEAGTWAIENADDARTATMVWTVEKTNCAGRDNGHEQRVQMIIPKAGEYKINFR